MSCHWSTFQAGGGAGGPEAKIYNRCNCTKAELGKCFQKFEIKEGDTIASIAAATDYAADFLRDINPALNSSMDLVYRRFQKLVPKPPVPEPPQKGRSGRRKKKPDKPEMENWEPTVSLDKESVQDDETPIGRSG
jgi:hypothetical protein